MEISIQKSNHLKSIAILMMLCLHLFNKNYKGLFEPLLFVGKQPLTYCISLFCDACVPVFAFVTGYGLYFNYKKNKLNYSNSNIQRLKKLYINYWIIILIFPVVLGLIMNNPAYPGSILKLFLNLTAIDPSYNGAWWFFTIYVMFVLTSSFWFRLVDNSNGYLIFFGLLILYVVGFYFRVYKTDIFNNKILMWLHRELALYSCTLFQFLLGAMSLKYRWNEKISHFIRNIKFRSLICVIIICVMIILHLFIPNFFIAPFTGIIFIFAFVQIELPEFGKKILDFFAVHSTNIWLVHMFFYMIFFPEFIYSFRYPVIIIFVLVLVCVLSSYVINFFYNRILAIIR